MKKGGYDDDGEEMGCTVAGLLTDGPNCRVIKNMVSSDWLKEH